MGIYKRKSELTIVTILTLNSSLIAFDIKENLGDSDRKLQMLGFAQLDARAGDGVIKDNENSSVKFGSQRVRFGYKYIAGRVRGKVFVDLNMAHEDKSGIGIPDMVKDAFIVYRADSALSFKFGSIKMPVGMGFTMPGCYLDIVERGFDKSLALERNLGLMVSGRNIGFGSSAKVDGFEMGHERVWRGFGYDLMVGNQAGRSGAVVNASAGDANSYAVRVMFDWGEALHSELSYGISDNAGGIAGVTEDVLKDTKDYEVFNGGVDSNFGRANIKAEYFYGKNIRGVEDWDETTLSLAGTYYITDVFELATKYIQGKSSKEEVDTDLRNTYLGFNIYLEPVNNKMDRANKDRRNQHKVQFNYILASGDKNKWNGLKGYRDNALLAQYQFKF